MKNIHRINGNIYITSDEEITEFQNNIWVYNNGKVWLWQNTMALISNNKPRKIILTTDQDLIKDGVQSIDDTFLEWFVKNPSCEEVEVELFPKFSNKLYGIILPKEEPKQEIMKNILGTEENLELFNENGIKIYEYFKYPFGYSEEFTYDSNGNVLTLKNSKGYSYEYTRDSNGNELTYKDSDGVSRGFDIPEYTTEEVYNLLEQSMKDCHLWELEEHYSGDYKNLKEWFEQFKKKQ